MNAIDLINKEAFAQTMQEHFDEIQLIKLEYLALEIEEAETKQLFINARNQVLQENEFFAETAKAASFAKRCNGEVIDRIANESDTWLMSDKDFNVYNKLCTKEMYKRGLTDATSRIYPQYQSMNKRIEYKRNMLKFFISLLPEPMQTVFNANFNRVVVQDKLLELFLELK